MTIRAPALVASALLAAACGGTSSSTMTPRPAASHLDLVYTDVPRRLHLDLYTPGGVPPFPLVVWIHGGSWDSGTKDLFPGHPALDLRDRGYAVATVEYRLSSEAVYPAPIDDVKAAVRWLRGNADTYGLDPGRVGAWGVSAGGHLAALLGTSGGVAAVEDLAQGHPTQSSRVQAVVDWSGPADLELIPPGRALDAPEARLLGCLPVDCPDRARLASPLTFIDPGDPPFLIQHGTADTTVDYHHSEHLHAALLAAGVRSTLTLLPGAEHVDLAFVTPQNLAIVEGFLDETLRAGR
jgi:acetyl esterase/lipase